jgi:hypothetical protein
MCRHSARLAGLVALLALVQPAVAAAQIAGIGPRFAVVRGDLVSATPTSRFVGGSARVSLNGLVGFEGALDFRTTWSKDRLARVRETPLQGSVLLFPVRTVLAPYALAGFGIYTRNFDVLGASGDVTQTAVERKTGIHMGFGAQVRVAKHAAFFVDYRYRFVKFGDQTTGTSSTGNGAAASSSAVANLINAVPGLGSIKVSHQGSMWTGGFSFVF